MQKERTALEELAFRTAELDSAMTAAGFKLAHTDPEAARDFSYRARYIRSKSTVFPPIHGYLEYYCAARAFSLKLSTTDEMASATFACIIKNHRGDLKELLDRYFATVRKGIPFKPEEARK